MRRVFFTESNKHVSELIEVSWDRRLTAKKLCWDALEHLVNRTDSDVVKKKKQSKTEKENTLMMQRMKDLGVT